MGSIPVVLRDGSPIRELDVVPKPVSVQILMASVGPSAGLKTRLASNFLQDCQSSDSGLGSVALLNKGK